MKRRAALLAGIALILGAGVAEARPLRVMTLDQCADQYVLALRPEADLALSPRADDPDAWLRAAATGRRQVRPTLEAAIAFRPDVVIRYWGGEPRLLDRLENTGVRVVTLDEANDFNGIRSNILTISEALGVPERGAALAKHMAATLVEAAPDNETPGHPAQSPAQSSAQSPTLYLTAGGFTAGRGTLVDAILKAAGFTNAADRPSFAPVSVERIALFTPARFVLGFFDQVRGDWRGPGRHPVVQRAARGRVVARLPAAVLTCPAWFAADAAVMLKAGV